LKHGLSGKAVTKAKRGNSSVSDETGDCPKQKQMRHFGLSETGNRPKQKGQAPGFLKNYELRIDELPKSAGKAYTFFLPS